MEQILCPSCKNTNPVSEDRCHHCGTDLASVKSVINTANKHYNEALTHARDGRNDEAIRELRTAIELWAENPNYHNVLGTCYANKGQYTDAVAAWEKTLSLDPAFLKAHGNIEKVRKMESGAENAGGKRASSGLAWGLALLCLIAAVGAGGFALYQKQGLDKQINALIDSNTTETEKQTQEIKDLKDSLAELQKQYNEIESASSESQTLLAALQETLDQSLEERDQNWILRSEHEKLLQGSKEAMEKNIKILQEQNSQLTQNSEAERNTYMQQVAELQTQIANIQASADSSATMSETSRTQINQVKVQLATVQRELDILKPRAVELEGQFQASREQLLAVEADRNQLRNAQAAEQENLTLASESVRALLAHDYANAISRSEAILEKNPNHSLAQTLLNAARQLEREWNDPVNAALREQRAQGGSTEIEQIKKSLVDQRIASSRELMAKSDYESAYAAASQAVEIEPAHEGANQNLEKVRAAFEQHQTALENVIAEIQSILANGGVFSARAQVRQVEAAYAYDKPFQALRDHVNSEAAERDKVLTAQIEATRPLYLAEDFDSAQKSAEAVLAENPENAAALALQRAVNEGRIAAHNRKIAELVRAARDSISQGAKEQARKFVDDLLALDPSNKDGLKLRSDIEKGVSASARSSS